MDKKRYFITVHGIVQGVGFRPFVYNIAYKFNIKGWVNNNSEGVYIDATGTKEDLEAFLSNIKNSPPPLSKVTKVIVETLEYIEYENFTIKESQIDENKITLISPDMAICDDCLKDIRDPHNRRYGYPFTNCTNCGPRFSIIKFIPYDRDKTTMEKFKMCPSCLHEYTDPRNRRFHAQPNACKTCGPSVYVLDKNGNEIKTEDPIKFIGEKIKEGCIAAIKGLSGFHLCCNGEDNFAINKLRNRKNRPSKAFAVMAKDMEIIKKHCNVNKLEEEILTGIRKPIVLLQKKSSCTLPESLAPYNKNLGVMLPYTPLHEILFWNSPELLVMTSANISGLPLEYINETAYDHLNNIADYFLMHNRDIYMPVDDSVTKVLLNKEFIIRRARGYAPNPMNYKDVKQLLCCGPNMKNTFAVSKENMIFLSSHIGDLENLETYEHYKRNIHHFINIFKVSPEAIIVDKHPLYMSTSFGEEYSKNNNVPLIYAQHHHAHLASCLAENKISHKVLGIIYDGTGYGDDEAIWGGEFLIGDLKDYKRIAHLSYVKLQGGDAAIKEPIRSLMAHLEASPLAHKEDIAFKLFGDKGISILKLVQKNFNCIKTSSIGRLFDAVSCLLNICTKQSYEGEASILLEQAIERDMSYNCMNIYRYTIEKNQDCYTINAGNIIEDIISELNLNNSKSNISKKFHDTVIDFTLHTALKIKEEFHINEVALSGGVFQNSYLLTNLTKVLTDAGFMVYTHSLYPSNDGGISLGQIAIGNEILKTKKP